MKQLVFFLLLGLACGAADSAHAQAPTAITVQGVASDDGAPLANGTYTVDLKLCTQESGGEYGSRQAGALRHGRCR